jgi:hypothetical protein
MDTPDRCFLLWRRADLIVATVADVPHREPQGMSFEGLECAPLEIGIFFNHLVSPDRRPRTLDRQIIGFELFTFPEDDDARWAMRDLLRARNVSGDADVMEILICPPRDFENDGAQGFTTRGFVNPNGSVVIAIPELGSVIGHRI